ncbi:MAG: hypothetical protein C5B51_07525 [Terriglobia bacterium]|nr:MAG: hypothetical protein C5B51_07525 [Terriglobia bacterium]
MNFQWIEMRIQEEKDRRQREERTLARLPNALEDVFIELNGCIQRYRDSFGAESAGIELLDGKMRITSCERQGEDWEARNSVEVSTVPTLPGFRIERPEQEAVDIVIGLLPGDKLFYRDQEQYITMEELTRKILDRTLFPKLRE